MRRRENVRFSINRGVPTVTNQPHGCLRSPDALVERDAARRWRSPVIDPLGADEGRSVVWYKSATTHMFIRCMVRPGRTTVYSTDQCVFSRPMPAQMSTRGQDGSCDGPDVQVIAEIALQTLPCSVQAARARRLSGGHSHVLELKDANARLPAVLSLVFLRHD